MQTVLYPLWKVHSWFLELPSSHSSFLLQDLGYIVLSVHVVVQENMYHVVLDYGKVVFLPSCLHSHKFIASACGGCDTQHEKPVILEQCCPGEMGRVTHMGVPRFLAATLKKKKEW